MVVALIPPRKPRDPGLYTSMEQLALQVWNPNHWESLLNLSSATCLKLSHDVWPAGCSTSHFCSQPSWLLTIS